MPPSLPLPPFTEETATQKVRLAEDGWNSRDDAGNWFPAYGNENWEFDGEGLMYARHASVTSCPLRRASVSSIGRWVDGLTSTLD